MTEGSSEASAATQPAAPRTIARSPFWWALSKYSVLVFSRVWFRLRIEGRDQLPTAGPVLLVANHTSYLDPPMVGISCRRWVGFLAKAGLAGFAPMRWWLAQVGVTLIDRKAPSKAAMRLVADALKAGEVVCVFPEGTRSVHGRIAPFQSGVEFLVRRTGAPVVPIGIDGAFRALPKGALLPRPRKVVVRYGAPWPAERVLAPGGVEALRRTVAELARCELAPVADATAKAAIDPRSSASAGGGA